ncbi:hypothetical protein J1N35_027796 [Gossypium stocksii]|uniref:CCHC-type domain-containing protein n=1 Tax=Gossypium stocksii TaxID=47602 RepID=A0A9D4A0J6_9ROSI|nr:hypothetical protein J1N35_027796 [Gossypium stocksii]
MVVLRENIGAEHLYDLCLVGRVLTDSVVHFPSLKNTLVDLWHPLRGVSISEMENKRIRRILFRFYSEIDLKRVLDGLPWFFNRHLILFHRLTEGEDPDSVPLWYSAFWVQIHNLPVGVTSEGTARQFGDFVRKFLEYDTSLVTRGGGSFMRVRVSIDVRLPLKRKKRINIGQNKSTYVLFQYERLPLFCFLCGRLGHGESYCEVRLTLESQQVEFGWDLSLRAAPRRGGQATRIRGDVMVNPRVLKGREIEEELENLPVEFLDRKKRQRFTSEKKVMGEFQSLVDGTIDNNLSAATQKVAGRDQWKS